MPLQASDEVGLWSAARSALPYCLTVMLAVRVTLGLIALIAGGVLPDNTAGGAVVGTPGWHNLWSAWNQWDSGWFLRIATESYTPGDGSAAFFPLYPLLIRAMTVLTGGHALAAALIVSHLTFLAGLVVVYLMSAREWGETMARRTVLYLSLFPTALFFFAPYSESLFLLLACTCLYAARRGNFGAAAVAGALASATRSIGVILAVCVLVEVIARARRASQRTKKETLWGVACAGFVLFGAFLYSLYWFRLSGDWLAPIHEQAGWQREFVLPFETLQHATRAAFGQIGVDNAGYHLMDWLVVIPMLACGVWVIRRAAAMYSVYTWLSLLIPLSFVFGGRPLMSLSRFILVMVPLFWALAYVGERWRLHETIVGISAGGLGLMTLLFATGYWVF